MPTTAVAFLNTHEFAVGWKADAQNALRNPLRQEHGVLLEDAKCETESQIQRHVLVRLEAAVRRDETHWAIMRNPTLYSAFNGANVWFAVWVMRPNVTVPIDFNAESLLQRLERSAKWVCSAGITIVIA